MKKSILIVCSMFILLAGAAAQQKGSFDIFSFMAPKGFTTEKTAAYAVVKKDNGAQYCNSFIMKARISSGNAKADFEADWQSHAAKQGVAKPANSSTGNQNGWTVTGGYGTATFKNQPFYILISTFTGKGITWCVVHYFNNESFSNDIAAFTASIVPDENKIAALAANTNTINNPVQQPTMPAGGMLMTKYTTSFNDGWTATVKSDYVQVVKAATEVRLYYINDALEKQRPNTVEPEAWYWDKIVAPAFMAPAPQKWVQVTYPVIYFYEGDATDKATGKQVYVAMKVIYEGGARVVVAIAKNKAAYQQQYPHPNDLNRMLGYNKFALTLADLPGTWVKNSGNGMEYYNAYTGNYTGLSAISTTDEFVFNGNGSYQSTHRYANTNNGGTQFGGMDYKGWVTVSDWELLATNRVGGKTKKFWGQLEAIKGGYLLILTDSDYEPLKYVLYRKQIN
jgi:hypothetical protein